MRNYSSLSIALIIIVLGYIHFNLHKWDKPEKVISWDIKSYYGYFPALIIENDIRLDFIDSPDYNYRHFFWDKVRTGENKRIIITTYGMALLYSPFSFVAHLLAPLFGYDRSGFSPPYAMALILSSLFYLLLGLYCLRKLLIRYFDDRTAALSMLGVVFGTNLYYYAAFQAPMVHVYSFSLNIVFLCLVDRWVRKQKLLTAVLIGLLGGVITLVRPSNVLILLLLIFWGVNGIDDLKQRITLFFNRWPLILIMILSFFVVWMPQFIYWKMITGKYLYYSYGVVGGAFYWDDPNFFKQLFSYRSGALVYSPFLVLAFGGLFFLYKREKLFIPVVICLTLTYYLLSCWWSWWNGGSLGIRSYIDTYGVLIFGFAALAYKVFSLRKIFRIAFMILAISLVAYGTFIGYQYHSSTIHYNSNSKKTYWMVFLKLERPKGYWPEIIKHQPDVFLARCGIDAYKNRQYESDNFKGCMINKIREIRDSDELFQSYIEQAREQHKNTYKFIRRSVEEECTLLFKESD